MVGPIGDKEFSMAEIDMPELVVRWWSFHSYSTTLIFMHCNDLSQDPRL